VYSVKYNDRSNNRPDNTQKQKSPKLKIASGFTILVQPSEIEPLTSSLLNGWPLFQLFVMLKTKKPETKNSFGLCNFGGA